MCKKLNKNSEIIDPKTGWDELNEAQKKAFRAGVEKLSKYSTTEDFEESDPKVNIPFQEALDRLVADSTPKAPVPSEGVFIPQPQQPVEAQAPQQEEIRTFGSGSTKFQEAMDALVDLPQEPHQRDESDEEMDRLSEEFDRNYKASVDKVVDTIKNEIRTNDCFAWTSYSQGATVYDLLADVIIEDARRGVQYEQAARGEILGSVREKALTLLGAQKTIDLVKRDIDGRVERLRELSEPNIVKRAFLHSGKEAKIIKEMYGDKFDSISPNRDKYLAFLKRVEDDGRIKELNDILSTMKNLK